MHKRERQAAGQTIEYTDEDEVKLCEVAKHSFGIITLYIQAFIGVVLGLGLSFFLLPSVMDDKSLALGIALLFAFVIIVLALLVVTAASLVYRQNRLIVTDRNITQILQFGLFNRKVSQLNMVNVEDVTSVQSGFLSTMLGYGDLIIETAGEQSNFKFPFCPNPGYYAKVILNAREKILGQHDGDHTVEGDQSSRRQQ